MLRLHVTGVGDAFTERYHNASLCVEEPQSGLRLQIDCPPAYPRVLADYRRKSGHALAVDNIDHLLLTHLHGDHCGGTEAYLYMRRFIVGRKPTLYGAPEVLSALWQGRLAGGMERLMYKDPGGGYAFADLSLLDYTDRKDLGPEVTRIGPLRIERRFTIHHIPTTAIRISVEGASRPLLGYSADTAFDLDLIHWLAEAEFYVHETNYGVHTPLESLLALPASLQQRMHLIHYPDRLDPATCPIRCLSEGETIEL